MKNSKKSITFVLVHGAWHGGWCWDLVSKELRGQGYHCEAPDLPIDNPGATFEDYADVVVRAIDNRKSKNSEVILVGHSRAANVLPRVAQRTTIKKHIFVCGSFEPAALGLSKKEQSELPAKHLPGADQLVMPIGKGLAVLLPKERVRQFYYNDCPADTADLAIFRLRPQRFSSKTKFLASLSDVPSAHLYSKNDRVVNPEYSQAIARNVFGKDTIALEGGHFSPLFAYPKRTAQIFIALATLP